MEFSNVSDYDLQLAFVGDVMLGRVVNEVLKAEPADYPWGDTLAVLGRADWRACNLECVISDVGEPWGATPKAFHFRSDTKNVAVLEAAGIDAVSIANNHVLDFEYEALCEMIRTLDGHGIGHAGAGLNSAMAFKPAISRVRGKTIALIAFSDNEPIWEAMESLPGIAYLPTDTSDERAKRLVKTIEETKASADVVVVSGHWGANWGYEPPKEHIRFAHYLIDSGADIIFGHSGHVFRGIELYKGRPIIYCAGNFIDDYAVDEVERNDESFVFAVGLDHDARPRHISLYPTIIGDCQARMAGTRAVAIAEKMQELCASLGTVAAWNGSHQRIEIEIG
jgi:poly-gamma-glutamate capsule biosynthesis protein CapA/YwtB (metallophosphatase superfamily)